MTCHWLQFIQGNQHSQHPKNGKKLGNKMEDEKIRGSKQGFGVDK